MKIAIALFSLGLFGCASYPNYYIKDSTITNQQQTTQPQVGWGGWGGPSVFVPGVTPNYYYYSPNVYGWGGWGGWGNRWGCW